MKKGKICLLLVLIFVCSMCYSGAFAAGLANDSVLSQHVKEADGTSGQNTNSGSGIKTGHLQDSAVTTNKVADGAVTNTKISDGVVTTGKIADGAVTDAKITGPISASKISSTGLNADTVDGKHASDLAPVVHTHNQSDVNGLESALAGKADLAHNHDGVYQKKYGNVIVVAKSGGDFTDPVEAMNSITDASELNPYLIKIMPGVYNIGDNIIAVKGYVDIEGSGKAVTKIYKGNYGGPTVSYSNMNNSEIRNITVEAYYSNPIMLITSSTNITLSNADLKASGNTEISGIAIISYSSATLNEVTIDAQYDPEHGCGIKIYDHSSIIVRNSNISGTRFGLALGFWVYEGYGGNSAEIYNSTLSGGEAAWAIGYGIMKAVEVKVNGWGYLPQDSKCINCYDANFNLITF